MSGIVKPLLEVTAQALKRGADAATHVTRTIPEEVPVALALDSEPFAVLMATPCDIEDLCYGFALTEGIIKAAQDIETLQIEHTSEGILANATLTKSARAQRVLTRRRNIEGRSSCGICGIEQLSDAVRALEPVAAHAAISRSAVEAALNAMDDAQSLNRESRAVHAAAFADPDGKILQLREDVGRHNALDKLIGGLMRSQTDRSAGFCVITSRCSYEMVDKAAHAGFGTLVAISAPTALALRKAKEANITLIALARKDGWLVF